ncbi:MAG: glycosyltransferase [Pseudomonadota bacterium]
MSLNVLHITPYYEEAWGYGGIPRVVVSLCKGLARRGHKVTVCTTDAKDANTRASQLGPKEVSKDAVEVRVFRNLSNTLAYHKQLFLPLGLKKYLKRMAKEFQVAHLHGCHNLPGTIAATELINAGVPYVLTPNGTALRIERRKLAKWVFDTTLGRQVLPGASRITAVTKAEVVQLQSLGIPPEKIAILPNPIDLETFACIRSDEEFRRRWQLPFSRFVLFLGKITPRKQIDLLVRAFSFLDMPDVGLVIAGNDMGGAKKAKRTAKNLHLGNRVQFVGQLEGNDRAAALAGAEVVAYPGRDEVFGLVPLEALLCGSPVVVADDSGCGEVIQKVGGGIVVSQGDLKALSLALADILADGEGWKPNISEAQVQIRQLFSGDTVAAICEQVYDEAIS